MLEDFEFGSSMPHRVLEITQERATAVRLITTSGKVDKYVALSDRWGSSESTFTTKKTLRDRMTNIAFEDLDKMYQDAVTVTTKLGLRYLWINALCIVQDDEEEWKAQVAVMGSIFQGAKLKIGASSADDPALGFLMLRNVLMCQPPYREKPGKPDGVMYMRHVTGHIDLDVGLAPLNQRGWVLQEHLLSRRILHFTKEQIYWEYRETDYAETILT